MKAVPVEITHRNTELSARDEADIRRRAKRLEKFCPYLQATRVTIDTPHRSLRTGSHHRVVIEMSVPGNDLVVSHEPGDVEAHADLSVAVRDAFQAARRELDDYTRIRRSRSRQTAKAR